MIETTLNVFDAIVVGVMGLSCALAFYRGFVRELLSLSAWVGAGIVTLYFFPDLAEALKPKFKNSAVAGGFSTLGIYIVSLMGFSLLNTVILKFIKSGTDVGLLDNWLGLLFGALRAAFLIAASFFLMTIVLPEAEYPKAIKTARSLHYVEDGAIIVAKISPKYLREISTLNKRIVEEEKNGGGIGKIYNPFDREIDAAKPKNESKPNDE